MWPFKKKAEPATQVAPIKQILYSQVDITENFGDNEKFKPDDWIQTIPLNISTKDGKSRGLPAINASMDEVYSIAVKMSEMRASISIPNDGVYCPICHIANIQLSKLHAPRPTCNRPLLKFGWD